MSETHSYPRHVRTDAGEIEFRLMSRADEAAVLAFAPRNISEPKVLAATDAAGQAAFYGCFDKIRREEG
jgi:hypothetical protein